MYEALLELEKVSRSWRRVLGGLKIIIDICVHLHLVFLSQGSRDRASGLLEKAALAVPQGIALMKIMLYLRSSKYHDAFADTVAFA